MSRVVVFMLMFSFSNVYAADIKASLAALEAKFKGKTPKINSSKMIKVEGKDISAPQMKIGRRKVNNNFKAVDAVKKEFGGTATIFVRHGDEFVRISTNVLKDGQRAIGTKLAKNAAYKTVMNKETFCGEVDILGNKYDTCYKPITGELDGKAGEIVGIWYVGYKK